MVKQVSLIVFLKHEFGSALEALTEACVEVDGHARLLAVRSLVSAYGARAAHLSLVAIRLDVEVAGLDNVIS
jgi:hypothetical protein